MKISLANCITMKTDGYDTNQSASIQNKCAIEDFRLDGINFGDRPIQFDTVFMDIIRSALVAVRERTEANES